MKNMSENHPTDVTQPAVSGHGGHDMSAMSTMEGMEAKPKLSTLNLVIVSLLSMAMLAGGFALAAHYGDLSMRAGDASMQMPTQSGAKTKNDGSKPQDMPGMKMPAN